MNPSSVDVNVSEGILYPRQFKWNMWCYKKNFSSMVDVFLERVSNLNLVSFIGAYE